MKPKIGGAEKLSQGKTWTQKEEAWKENEKEGAAASRSNQIKPQGRRRRMTSWREASEGAEK